MAQAQFKIPCVGSTNVGKTALLTRLQTGEFIENTMPTTSISIFPITKIDKNGNKITLTFWDTAGQERFKGLGKMYYQGGSALLAIFDSTSIDSFNSMKEYIEMDKEINGNHVIVIAANKIDLLEDQASLMPAMNWAYSMGYQFIMTSAKGGDGINDIPEIFLSSLSFQSKAADDDIADQIEITTEYQKDQSSSCC